MFDRPVIRWSNPPFSCLFLCLQVHPLGNLLYTRDQQIVTARGLILGRIHTPQRMAETDIMRFVWRALDIPIIAEVCFPFLRFLLDVCVVFHCASCELIPAGVWRYARIFLLLSVFPQCLLFVFLTNHLFL